MGLPPDNDVPTLGEMQRSTSWVWLTCTETTALQQADCAKHGGE
jgi:hypothetical protein